MIKNKSKRSIIRLAYRLEKLLKEDILARYHNTEYWGPDIIEEFQHNEEINEKDMNNILNSIGD